MSVSETTPLLNGPTTAFPNISDALLQLGDRVDRVSLQDVYPAGDVCSGASFRLILLLELRTKKLRQKPNSADVWNQWTDKSANESDIHRINEQIINAWDLFLSDFRATAEIERVLWTAFPINNESSRMVRVVDLLNADCPRQLICHPVVILSLVNLWKHGPSREVARHPNSMSRLGLRYDAMCTPRVLHCLDLVSHLAYFGLLVSYVMHPPYEPTISDSSLEYTGWREILLMVFSASILFRPWSLFKIPALILFVVFVTKIPSVPFAGSLGFDVLLICFAANAFLFHLPSPPSPLFLFKVHRSLPFAAFLAHGFYDTILPIILFFLPIFILGTTWLSMALAETFFVPSSLIPTPIQTRTTVLYMFFTLLVTASCSLFIFVVQGRSPDADGKGWDSYSSKIGRNARASFVRALIAYSSPYTFPAPFNLLQVVLIGGPSVASKYIRLELPFAQVEKVLWRTVVGPVGLVCALMMSMFP